MNSLLKTALLRTFGFFLLVSLSSLLFIHVEYTEKDDKQEKYQLLSSLFMSMGSKCNMSLEEFNKFCGVAYEALRMPKPKWTYLHAIDFVVQTVTTMGKYKADIYPFFLPTMFSLMIYFYWLGNVWQCQRTYISFILLGTFYGHKVLLLRKADMP